MLCLDLKRPVYEAKPVFGIQVMSSDRAFGICMLPHRYWLLWKSSSHSCCLHNHGANTKYVKRSHPELMFHTFLLKCLLSHFVLRGMSVLYLFKEITSESFKGNSGSCERLVSPSDHPQKLFNSIWTIANACYRSPLS